MQLIHKPWMPEYKRLMEWPSKYIVSGPTLSRLDSYRRFYIKIDWPNYGMGEVILQAENTSAARNYDAQEKDGKV